jgi:hypothetical protein
MAAATESRPDDWKSAVRVREDPDLAGELALRYASTGRGRAVSVTDLLDPRHAYWRRSVTPPRPSPERAAAMALGRAWHHWVGNAVAREGSLEVRLRRDGISCRIDLLTDVPVEIKTGSGPVPSDVLTERPEHVEQLGMYCALLGSTHGRLVHIGLSNRDVADVRATDLAWSDISAVHAELDRRADGLRRALERRSPEGLERCRWFGRGCEFQGAGLCDCQGDEPSPASEIVTSVRSVTDLPDLASEWKGRLFARRSPAPVSSADRFRDLVYPRRTFFDRTRPADPEGAAAGLPGEKAVSLYDRLLETVESGPPGELVSLPTRDSAPPEEVAGYRGQPVVVRTSRLWARMVPDDILNRFPQYALELGFRCAAAGTDRGRIVVGYERAEEDRDRIQVLEVRFDPVERLAAEARDREERLAAALGTGGFRGLPPCAAWMFSDCPYRAECACDADGGRSQR